MALDVAVLRTIRTFVVGEPPVDEELEEAYTRLGESWQATAVEYLRERYFTLLRNPAGITVPGQISLNTAENLKHYRDLILSLGGFIPDDEGLPVAVGTVVIAPLVRLDGRRD